MWSDIGILGIHYAVSPNLPLWGVRRWSGLWLQPTLDGMKIAWYKNKAVISTGNSVCFASDQMLKRSFKSVYIWGVWLYSKDVTSWGIPLFYNLSVLYSVVSCTFLIFLLMFFDQTSILPFLLIRDSCWKTACSPLFLNISSKNRNLKLPNESFSVMSSVISLSYENSDEVWIIPSALSFVFWISWVHDKQTPVKRHIFIRPLAVSGSLWYLTT